MNKKARLVGLSCLLALGILAGCNKKADSASEPVKRDTPVEVEEVQYGSLSDTNQLTGTIIPETEVEVMPKAQAEFTKILVKKGDVVKNGQLLAQLKDTDERNAVKQQEAALKQAQSGLKSAQSGLSSAQNSLKSAQSGKTKAEQSYEQSQASVRQVEASLAEARKAQTDNLDNLDFQIKNAKLAWDQAKKNLERMEILHEEGLISEVNYEDAVKGEETAKIAYDQVVLNKDQAGSEISLQSLEASLDQAKIGASIAQSSIQDAVIGIAQAQAQVEQAKAAVEQAQAQVEQAQLSVTAAKERLADKRIVATASGEITEVNGEVGAMPSAQQPFAKIVSINKVKISANILPAQLETFKIGDSVYVEVSGLPHNYTGTVTYVSAVSSGSGLFALEAEVDNGEKLIRPGMVASIIVNEVLEADSLLVPTTSIIEKEGKSYVFTIEDELANQIEVEVLRYGTEVTAVAGELKENEQVVTKGQNLLQDGDAVKIMGED